jgi:hypothetical protein
MVEHSVMLCDEQIVQHHVVVECAADVEPITVEPMHRSSLDHVNDCSHGLIGERRR